MAEEEVYKRMGQLSEAELSEVCLQLDEEASKCQGNKSKLLKWLLKYLTSDTIMESEDQGGYL